MSPEHPQLIRAPSVTPAIRRCSRILRHDTQNRMLDVVPRPANPLLVSLKGKEHNHDLKESGSIALKSTPSRKMFTFMKRFAVVTVVIFLFHTIFRFLKHDVQTITFATRESFLSATTGSRADWEGEVPEFCKRMIANPKPRQGPCKRDPKTMDCAETGEPNMFSQFKQDYYFYTEHFAKLNRPGIYLDVAANDPFHYSNSFFMDRCLGWKGICVEGNPSYHEKLYRERSCQLVPTCVGRNEGEQVKFSLAGGAGGVTGETFKNEERLAGLNKTFAEIRERCTTMKTVLRRNNIERVDFLSLDVEGHELEVLKGFDWDNTVINVVTIETSPKTRASIEQFMADRGYKIHHPQMDERSIRTGLIHEDAVFLHQDVVFGSPV